MKISSLKKSAGLIAILATLATSSYGSGGPSIDTPPSSQTCYPGNTVIFTADVSGSLPLSFQWSYNGTDIPNATNSTLTLTNVQFNQSGIYGLAVTNEFGSDANTDATLTVYAPQPAAPPPDGLVSWWPADGNANDVIGGNNGALLNDVTFENAREGGQTFVFNDSNAGVNIGAATNLQLQDFTIEAWIQRGDSSFVSLDGGTGWLFSYGNGGYSFGINDDGTLVLAQAGADSVTSEDSITDTDWYHVAVTKYGSDVEFYIDGYDVGDATLENVFNFSTSATIGAQTASPGSPSNSFYGAIDEISVYNRDLSPIEIQSIARADGGKTQQLPQLKASISDGNILLSWPSWAEEFTLEGTTDNPDDNATWYDVDSEVDSDGEIIFSEIPVTEETEFFRLVYQLPIRD